MSTFSYFTEKLSAELRVQIYSHVFGTSPCAKCSSTTPKLDDENDRQIVLVVPEVKAMVLMDTSIFAVNKLVSAEALETFYNTKTIRLTFGEVNAEKDAAYLNRVRTLNIAGCLEAGTEQVTRALCIAEALPRIKAISIVSEELAYCTTLSQPASVRDWAETVLGLGAICTNIGCYQLIGHPKVSFTNSKLVKLWPEVTTMAEDFDFQSELESRRADAADVRSLNNCVSWLAQTSLPLWVGLLEARVSAADEEHPDIDMGDLTVEDRRWLYHSAWSITVKITPTTNIVPQGEDGMRVPMHKLKPGHDPVTLEWATELLAINLNTYVLQSNGFSIDAKAHWPQVDGGEGVSKLLSRARTREIGSWLDGAVNRDLVNEQTFDTAAVQTRLLLDHVLVGCFGEQVIKDASFDELKQMLYLAVATGRMSLGPFQADAAVGIGEETLPSRAIHLERWAQDLLCRYLSAVRKDDEFLNTDLSELQERFKLMLSSAFLWATLGPGAPNPGALQSMNDHEDFNNNGESDASVEGEEQDEDLYVPFVAVLRHLLRLGVSVAATLARQTVAEDEGSEEQAAAAQVQTSEQSEALGQIEADIQNETADEADE